MDNCWQLASSGWSRRPRRHSAGRYTTDQALRFQTSMNPCCRHIQRCWGNIFCPQAELVSLTPSTTYKASVSMIDTLRAPNCGEQTEWDSESTRTHVLASTALWHDARAPVTASHAIAAILVIFKEKRAMLLAGGQFLPCDVKALGFWWCFPPQV